jgi:hypothetical protein
MNTENEFVSIVVAGYALVEVIKALADGGIKDYAITKEDNDLVIRIRISRLKRLEIYKNVRSYTSK